MAKSPGPKLFFSQFGGEQPIPPEFIAAMRRAEERQPVPNEVGPEELSDTVVESKVETNRTNERVRVTVLKAPGRITLRDVNTDQDGMPVQITRTLFPTGEAPEIPSATTDIAVKDLGNGWSIQESGLHGSYDEDGNFIPGVFDNAKYTKEIPEVIPERFRTNIPTVTTELNVEGTAELPVLAPGDLLRSQEQIKDAVVREVIRGHADVALPQTLIEKDTNPKKQIVTKTVSYKAAGSDAVPTATKDVEVQNLGGGRVLQTESVVPEVFDEASYEKSIPDVVPPEFRVAIPTSTVKHTNIDGQAALPTLGSGELSRTERQINEFTKEVSITNRSGVTSAELTDKDTNERRQVVTITKKYRPAGVDPVPNTNTEVEVKDLGDGNVVETVKKTPGIFRGNDFTTEISETVPPEFRALLQTETEGFTEAGTVTSQPVLLPGERSKRLTQVDGFNRHSETVRRAAAPGGSLTDKYFGGVEAGGSLFSGIVSRLKTYSPNTILAPDESFSQFASKVTSLGSGDSVKETDTLSAYPVFTDYTKEEDGFSLRHIKSIVATGTPNPTVGFYSQKVIDSQRTLRIQTDVNDTDIPPLTLHRIFDGTIDVSLPSELESVTYISNAQAQGASYDSVGSYGFFNNGNGSLSLHATARVGAGVIGDAYFKVRHPWGDNVPCMHYLFFRALSPTIPVTEAIILAHVNTIRTAAGLSGGVLLWPKFAPEEVNIIAKSSRVSGFFDADVHAADSTTTDYLGVRKFNAFTRNSGEGAGGDIELGTKIIRIPPTIHSAKTPVQPTLSQVANSVGTLTNGSAGSASVGGTATASIPAILPSTIPATAGQATIPTSGVRLFLFFIEYYRYGYGKVHAITVDFADIL